MKYLRLRSRCILVGMRLITVAVWSSDPQVIFRQGDPASACYVVVEGKVGVFVRDPSTPPTPREVHHLLFDKSQGPKTTQPEMRYEAYD
eukprot:3582918-Amphidinium_carterae.1